MEKQAKRSDVELVYIASANVRNFWLQEISISTVLDWAQTNQTREAMKTFWCKDVFVYVQLMQMKTHCQHLLAQVSFKKDVNLKVRTVYFRA